jgi:hypothetical protein
VTPAEHFFTTLYAGQSGVLELRTKPRTEPATAHDWNLVSRLRDFVPVRDGAFDLSRVERFIAATTAERMEAYFGVALRTPDAATHRRGDAAHCATLTTLFVDADFKKLGEAATRQRLKTFATQPSIVVNSGGGVHPYWLLATPLDLQTFYRETRALLQRLAYHVADIVDTGVSEPARVLRIPGSLNFKYDPPRPVALEHISDATLDPDLVPGHTEADATGTPSRQPLHVPDTVAAGDRHATMRDLMRSLQSRGVPLAGALAACHVENRTRCRPAIDPRELDSYLRRVAQLPDRPGFTRTPQTGWELAGSLFETGLSADAVLTAVRAVTPDFDPEHIDG